MTLRRNVKFSTWMPLAAVSYVLFFIVVVTVAMLLPYYLQKAWWPFGAWKLPPDLPTSEVSVTVPGIPLPVGSEIHFMSGSKSELCSRALELRLQAADLECMANLGDCGLKFGPDPAIFINAICLGALAMSLSLGLVFRKPNVTQKLCVLVCMLTAGLGSAVYVGTMLAAWHRTCVDCASRHYADNLSLAQLSYRECGEHIASSPKAVEP